MQSPVGSHRTLVAVELDEGLTAIGRQSPRQGALAFIMR